MSANEELGIKIVIGKEVEIDSGKITSAVKDAIGIAKGAAEGFDVFKGMTQSLSEVTASLTGLSKTLNDLAKNLKPAGAEVDNLGKKLRDVKQDAQNLQNLQKISLKVDVQTGNLDAVKGQYKSVIAEIGKAVAEAKVGMPKITLAKVTGDIEKTEAKRKDADTRASASYEAGDIAANKKAVAELEKYTKKLKELQDLRDQMVAGINADEHLRNLKQGLSAKDIDVSGIEKMRTELNKLTETLGKIQAVPAAKLSEIANMMPAQARSAQDQLLMSRTAAFGSTRDVLLPGWVPPKLPPLNLAGVVVSKAPETSAAPTSNIETIAQQVISESQKAKALTDKEIKECESLLVKIKELEKSNANLAKELQTAIEGRMRFPAKVMTEAAKALGYDSVDKLKSVLDATGTYKQIQQISKETALAATGAFNDPHKLTNDVSYKQRDKELQDRDKANTLYLASERKLQEDRAALAEAEVARKERDLAKLAEVNRRGREAELEEDRKARAKGEAEAEAYEARLARRVRRREEAYAGRLMKSLAENGQTIDNGQIVNTQKREEELTRIADRSLAKQIRNQEKQQEELRKFHAAMDREDEAAAAKAKARAEKLQMIQAQRDWKGYTPLNEGYVKSTVDTRITSAPDATGQFSSGFSKLQQEALDMNQRLKKSADDAALSNQKFQGSVQDLIGKYQLLNNEISLWNQKNPNDRIPNIAVPTADLIKSKQDLEAYRQSYNAFTADLKGMKQAVAYAANPVLFEYKKGGLVNQLNNLKTDIDDFSRKNKVHVDIDTSRIDLSKVVDATSLVAARTEVAALVTEFRNLKKAAVFEDQINKELKKIEEDARKGEVSLGRLIDTANRVKNNYNNVVTRQYTNDDPGRHNAVNAASDNLRNVLASIGSTPTKANIDEVTAAVRRLQHAVADFKETGVKVGSPLASFNSALKRAVEEAFNNIGDLHANAKRTAAALNEAFASQSIKFDSQEKINAGNRELSKYNNTLRDGVAVAKNANNAFAFLGDTLGRMAKRLTEFYSLRFIIFAIGSEFREATSAAMAFSQNVHDIAAIAGASQREMESLGQSILTIARHTRFTSQEVANLMQLLAQAGVSASQLATVAETVGQFATATGTKPEMAADLVTTSLNVFDIKATDTIKVTNALTAALNESKLTSQGLGTAFNYLAPQAEQLGISMEQTLGMIATMAQAGIKPSTIGTGTSQLLKELAAPKQRLKDMLDYYSIKQEDVDPTKNSFAKIVETFTNATGKLGEQGVQVQHAMTALETRVGRALVTAMNLGSAAFDQMTEAVTGTNAAWIAFYKSMDGAQAKMNVVKQNFQAAMIALFDQWLPALKGGASGLESFTNWLNTSSGQAVMFGTSLTVLAGAIWGVVAAIAALNVTAAGSTFLSYFKWLANPYVLAGLAIVGTLAGLWALLSNHEQSAKEKLEEYNKEMFKGIEATEKSQAGLRNVRYKTDDGGEANAMIQYEQTVRKYGQASAEAIELKKQYKKATEETKVAEAEAMKEYNQAVKEHGQSSREALAAKERYKAVAVQAQHAETEALKRYNEAVQKHGETSAEAIDLKGKNLKLTDDTKISLNKLKSEYPQYLSWLNVENMTIEKLNKAYADLDKARRAQAERDKERYNKDVGPTLWKMAMDIRKAEEELQQISDPKTKKGKHAALEDEGYVGKTKGVLEKKIADMKKAYEDYKRAAQPLQDRLNQEGFNPYTFVEDQIGGVIAFGDRVTSEKDGRSSVTPVPKTKKAHDGNSQQEYKEHYDAIAEKKKKRDELLALVRMDGTSIAELEDAIGKVRVLEDELENLLIADYQNKARYAAVQKDKHSSTGYSFLPGYKEAAKKALDQIPEWKAYFEAHKESSKTITQLYYDYQQSAAKDRAVQEAATLRGGTWKVQEDAQQKIEGYLSKFNRAMYDHEAAETDQVIASQQSNLDKIISSTYTTEEKRADAVIKAKQLARDRIDAETAKKEQKIYQDFFSSDTSIQTTANQDEMVKTRDAILAGGETRKAESDRKIDADAFRASDVIFNSDKTEKDADRTLRLKQQTLAIQKDLANSAEEIHQLDLQGIQDQIDINQMKKEAFEREVREGDKKREELEKALAAAAPGEEEDSAWANLIAFSEKYNSKLEGTKEKLEAVKVLLGELQGKQTDLADESFFHNFQKGWDDAAKKIGTVMDLYKDMGGKAFEGLTSSLDSAFTVLWNPDDSAVASTKNNIKQLQDELQKLQEQKAAIIAKGPLMTGTDKANLADYTTQIDSVNSKMREQRDMLQKQTNAWRALKDGIAKVLEDIAQEIQKFLVRQMVIKFMKFLGTFFGGNSGAESGVMADGNMSGDIDMMDSDPLAGFKPKADGGLIPLSAGIPNQDSVPIMAMPGEIVIKKSSVDAIGPDKLLYANERGQLPKFASGGVVGGSAKNSAFESGGGKEWVLNIFNIADPNSVPQVTGEQIVNVVSFDMAKKGALYRQIRGIMQGV